MSTTETSDTGQEVEPQETETERPTTGDDIPVEEPEPIEIATPAGVDHRTRAVACVLWDALNDHSVNGRSSVSLQKIQQSVQFKPGMGRVSSWQIRQAWKYLVIGGYATNVGRRVKVLNHRPPSVPLRGSRRKNYTQLITDRLKRGEWLSSDELKEEYGISTSLFGLIRKRLTQEEGYAFERKEILRKGRLRPSWRIVGQEASSTLKVVQQDIPVVDIETALKDIPAEVLGQRIAEGMWARFEWALSEIGRLQEALAAKTSECDALRLQAEAAEKTKMDVHGLAQRMLGPAAHEILSRSDRV